VPTRRPVRPLWQRERALVRGPLISTGRDPRGLWTIRHKSDVPHCESPGRRSSQRQREVAGSASQTRGVRRLCHCGPPANIRGSKVGGSGCHPARRRRLVVPILCCAFALCQVLSSTWTIR
jgi:hypothetical protein